MTKTAKTIQDAVIIIRGPEMMDGKWWVQTIIGSNDYEGYAKLPKAITFEGRTYGLCGWNSDTGNVSYSTGKKIALKADK